jgi:hypothetical protein
LISIRAFRYESSDIDVCGLLGFPSGDSRSYDAVIRIYDAVGNLIETHEHTGHF